MNVYIFTNNSAQFQIETAESLEKLSLAPEDIKPVAPSAIETPQLDIPANELLKDIAKPIEESKDEGKRRQTSLSLVHSTRL